MENREILKVEDLTIHFHSHEGVVRAVNGVDFSVRRSEILGIVGESGCGKSTVALSILRLLAMPPGRIVSGHVAFKGSDLLSMTETELEEYRGNRISMIFQDPLTSLNPVLTVGLQVGEVFEYHKKLEQSAIRERTLEMLREVGIPSPKERIREYPHQFSGGMRQRIMIAIAMACEPDLLIADEPTTALDVTIQAQVLTLMRRLCQRVGTAVVLITHDMGVVARMCDNVAVMYSGQIMEQADIEAIFESPYHPYTQGLLRCIPRGRSQEKLIFIEGQPPRLTSEIKGCAFAERCSLRMPRCSEELPAVREVSQGHLVRCFR